MLQYISPDSCYHNILDVHSGLESAVQADIIYAGSLYAAGNTLKEDNMVTDIPAFPTFGWICKLNESRKFSGSIGTSKTGTFTVHTIEYHIWK